MESGQSGIYLENNMTPMVTLVKCTGCGNCVRVCTASNTVITIENNKAIITYPNNCEGCRVCENACEFGAISIVDR
jgi:ferredoxin